MALIGKEIVGKKMYFLDYNENTELVLKREKERVSGNIQGNMVELKEKKNMGDIECSFNSKIVEEVQPIKDE